MNLGEVRFRALGIFWPVWNGTVSLRELIKLTLRNKPALLFFLNNTCSLGRILSSIVKAVKVFSNAVLQQSYGMTVTQNWYKLSRTQARTI